MQILLQPQTTSLALCGLQLDWYLLVVNSNIAVHNLSNKKPFGSATSISAMRNQGAVVFEHR
jgi:hypothetical protein